MADITAPTLLVFGDADLVCAAHMVEFFRLLGGGLGDPGRDGTPGPAALAILPGHTHYVMAGSPAVAKAAIGFLDQVSR